MTQRKPKGVTWESFVERQIREAQGAGEFDHLPGFGQPLADIDERQARETLELVQFEGGAGHVERLDIRSVDDWALMRQRLEKTRRRNRVLHFLGSPAHKWLADLDEVVEGRGDGAVAVRRGKLDGVDDVVILSFRHSEVLQEPASDAMRDLHGALLERLQRY